MKDAMGNDWYVLARDLSAVAGRLEGKDAEKAAATLIAASLSQGGYDPTVTTFWLTPGLSAMLSAIPPAEIPTRSATAER